MNPIEIVTSAPQQPPPAAPEGEKLEHRALSLFDQASALKVVDQPTYDRAVEFLKGVKALRNEAEAHHRPVIDAAHKAHKAAVAALQRIDAPLEQAERAVKRTLADWTAEQERIRRAEEERLRLEAIRQQEEEAERQIEAAEAEGASPVEIEALIEQSLFPAPAPPVAAPKTFAPAAGVAVRKTYGAEVIDLKALVQFVATRPEYLYLVMADLPKVNALARMQGAALRIPGVRVVEKSSVAVR